MPKKTNQTTALLGFLVNGMLLTKAAILAEFELFWSSTLIFCCRVVALLALGTRERNNISHRAFPFRIEAGRSMAPRHPFTK